MKKLNVLTGKYMLVFAFSVSANKIINYSYGP